MKKVIGIGNALTDMLVNMKSDDVLDTFGIARGSMSLVDTNGGSESKYPTEDIARKSKAAAEKWLAEN